MGNYPLKQKKSKSKGSETIKDKHSLEDYSKILEYKLKQSLIESHEVNQHGEVTNLFCQNSGAKLDSTMECDRSTTCSFYSEIKDEKVKSSSLIRDKYFLELSKRFYFTKDNYSDEAFQTISIFDWDDTFMCTSYISPFGFLSFCNIKEMIDSEDLKILSELEEKIQVILELAIQRGHTYIVTNATQNWVEYSAQALFPKLSHVLKKVVVISARSWFQHFYSDNTKMWKISTFNLIASIYPKHKHINLIAIGDSLIEMEASYQFAKRFRSHFIKTIKLRDSPTAFQLVKELNAIQNDLPYIYSAQTSVVISVKKEVIKPRITHKNIRNREAFFDLSSKTEEEAIYRNTVI